MEWMISAFDTYEPDPNGHMQIFGIGTRVRVFAENQRHIGTVTKIGRRKLAIYIPELKATRMFYPYQLQVLKG